MPDIRFSVNGKAVAASADPEATLLDFLREELGLTGAKRGCDSINCGACSVIVNGRARRSCSLPLSKLDGAEVETIENLGREDELHPIQTAFLYFTAVQCGFCTPGMIMAAKALLDRNTGPSEEEIKQALKHNICRCTGYERIIKAVKLAGEWLAKGAPPGYILPDGQVGENCYDLEGRAKVTGRLLYTDDLKRENALIGKILWAGHPHARVISVDPSAARAMPGVREVLTYEDVPGLNAFGVIKSDQPVLARDRVRFMGDAVALVLAESGAQARAALDKIAVVYEPLPVLSSPEKSLAPGSPRLHPEGNIAKTFHYDSGDVEAALAGAHITIAAHFSTPFVEHAYLECESSLAETTADGEIVVFVGTQYPFEARESVSAVLNLPLEKVRVITSPIGGAFGGKTDQHVSTILAALGAYKTKSPVKITLERSESIKSSTKRHPFEMDYRVGFDAEGRIVGLKAELVSDAGPYLGQSDQVLEQGCIFATGPYRIPNVEVAGKAVFTNNAMSGAFRGYGINQGAFSIETIMDEASRRLKLDPLELRLRNILRQGDVTPAGERLTGYVAARDTLEAAREVVGGLELGAPRPGWKRGLGVATAYKNVGWGRGSVDDGTAYLGLAEDGKLNLVASAPDMGQGIRTGMYQIVRNVFGLERSCLEFSALETSRLSRSNGGSAERLTFCTGNAVLMASNSLKEMIVEEIGRTFGLPPAELIEVDKGAFYYQHGPEKKFVTLAQVAEKLCGEGRKLEVEEVFQASKTYSLAQKGQIPEEEYRLYPAYSYTTSLAVVEVEEATGRVEVKHLYILQDVGRAINPEIIRSQLEGSCLQALGYALTEKYELEEGIPKTVRFGQLGVPDIKASPRYTSIIIEAPDPHGPFGAKGISEVAMVPTTPAITNAVTDATGVRVYSLPVSPDHIKAGWAHSGRRDGPGEAGSGR
ncbi:MAG: molybdopterin cofactor-binding domain-containing protein [Thermodesulfobacteriota bacterium]